MSSGFLLGCTVSSVALQLTTPSSRTEVELNRDFTKWGRRWGACGAAPRRFPLPIFYCGRVIDGPKEAEKLTWPSVLTTQGRMLVHHLMFEADVEYRSEIAPFMRATALILIR